MSLIFLIGSFRKNFRVFFVSFFAAGDILYCVISGNLELTCISFTFEAQGEICHRDLIDIGVQRLPPRTFFGLRQKKSQFFTVLWRGRLLIYNESLTEKAGHATAIPASFHYNLLEKIQWLDTSAINVLSIKRSPRIKPAPTTPKPASTTKYSAGVGV